MFVTYEGPTILTISDAEPEGVSFIETSLSVVELKDYEIHDGKLVRKNTRAFVDMKIAMISSYGINCGIATYTEHLCREMRPLVKDFRIFSEYSDITPNRDNNVVRCFSRELQDFSHVLGEISAFAPDVVYVQHEYGCFANVARWNTLIGHLSSLFRTIVVLHSVYNHPDKLAFEAPCQEIITHSKSGMDLLRSRGIDHCPIYLIPHGCAEAPRLEMKFAKPSPIIFQYGFGFEYKGWSNVIEIMKHLPDVTYIGVFNISKFSEAFNTRYYNELMARIRSEGLQDRVVLHRGFRSEQVLLSYMQQATVNLFPYWNHPDWRVHGASGAIRLALASGTPTVVGDVPFFDELRGYVPVCSDLNSFVSELQKLFANEYYRDEIRANQVRFVEERSWDKVALKYLEVLRG